MNTLQYKDISVHSLRIYQQAMPTSQQGSTLRTGILLRLQLLNLTELMCKLEGRKNNACTVHLDEWLPLHVNLQIS